MIGLLLSALDPFKMILLWGLKKIPLLLENPALKDHLTTFAARLKTISKSSWCVTITHAFALICLTNRKKCSNYVRFRIPFKPRGLKMGKTVGYSNTPARAGCTPYPLSSTLSVR